MSDIRLTGVPEDLAAKIEAAWDLSVSVDDEEPYWAARVERAEALKAAYDELVKAGISGLLLSLVIDALNFARSEVHMTRRNLDSVRERAARAVPS